MRERENLFSDYQDELRRKEKDEKYQKKEQVSKRMKTSWHSINDVSQMVLDFIQKHLLALFYVFLEMTFARF